MRQSHLRYFGTFLGAQDGFLHVDDTPHGALDARSCFWRSGTPSVVQVGETFLEEAVLTGHVATKGHAETYTNKRYLQAFLPFYWNIRDGGGKSRGRLMPADQLRLA
jgi:hypothetical protein